MPPHRLVMVRRCWSAALKPPALSATSFKKERVASQFLVNFNCNAMNVVRCHTIAIWYHAMWCNVMQCNVVRPLRSYFPTHCLHGGRPLPLSGSIHPRVSIERAGLRPNQIFCSRMVRGADKRCRTVRTKVRVRSGGSARHSGSQWRWTGVRLATILGHWSRTLRSDNGVQRVTLRFNSSQAETHLSFHFQDFRLISCFAGKLLSHLFCSSKN